MKYINLFLFILCVINVELERPNKNDISDIF